MTASIEATLDRVTIFMITYERKALARRAMTYWAKHGAHMVVMDGSAQPMDDEFIGALPRRIRYVHDPSGVHRRVQRGVDLVETDFVIWMPDDEFYVPDVLARQAAFLDDNADFVAVCSRCAGFQPARSGFQMADLYTRFPVHLLHQEDDAQRMNFHLGSFTPTAFMALFRADLWLRMWRAICAEKEFHWYSSMELLWDACASFAGKSTVIPELGWLRSLGEAPPTRDTDPTLDSKRHYSIWREEVEGSDEWRAFIEALARCLKAVNPIDGFDYAAAARGALDSFSAYHEAYYKPNLRGEMIMSGMGAWRPWMDHVKALRGGGVKVEVAPVKEIANIVQRFHGFAADTLPDAGWSEAAYLAANPDVARAVRSGAFPSGHAHYLAFGQREGRRIA